MKAILVIGATGTIGRQVLSQLIDAGAPVRGMARHPETAGLPPDVETIAGDLTRPETLDAALDGVDSVFLLWTAPAAATGPAIEKIGKRARRIVFLSSPYKTQHPLFQAAQPNPMSAMHAEIERLIENSGMNWTFVRPGMFAANAIAWWSAQIRSGDVVRWPYLSSPTAPIDERDIAAVAARALLEERHAGTDYVVTGPESLTQEEQITTIGRAIGRTLRAEEISPDQARSELLPYIPEFALGMLLTAWAGAQGQRALVTSTVAEVTGRPARTFFDWATANASAFRA
jgi:uncharacterized protein YbjT (DUF2867 family)